MTITAHTRWRGMLLLLCASFARAGLPQRTEQSAPARERLHGVRSRVRLSPPLRSLASQVRFSPDGRYVLVQDEGGIYVLTVSPLELRLYVRATQAPPARFTADSKTLVVASRGLQVWRWALPDGANVQEQALSVGEGCLASALSPDGELAACYGGDLTLRLYRTATGEKILSERITVLPDHPGLVIVPRVQSSPFAEPVGFLLFDSMKALVGQTAGINLVFSRDTRYLLIAGAVKEAAALDLATGKKVNVPGLVKRHLRRAICFVGPDQLAVLDLDKPGESALVSFPNGKTIAPLPVAGTSAESASDPRYLRVTAAGEDGSRFLDLETGKPLDWLPKGSADIREGVAAVLSEDGELRLIQSGSDNPFARLWLPLAPLAPVRTANVSPTLEGLVLVAGGDGGIYRIATGTRVARDKENTGRLVGRGWCSLPLERPQQRHGGRRAIPAGHG